MLNLRPSEDHPSAQQALAEFLEVDEDLLAGAGMGSPTSQDEEVSQKLMDEWIHDLPGDQGKIRYLMRPHACWRTGGRQKF